MATVEIELRNYKKQKTKLVDGKKVVTVHKDSLQPLVLRITSGGKVSRRNTGLYIRASEWDAAKRRVNRKHSEWAKLNDALDTLCREAEGAKADLITARQPVTGQAVLAQVFKTQDFYAVARKFRDDLGPEQAATKKNYDVMMSRLQAFAPSLSIEEITPEFLRAFMRHLRTRGQEDKDGNPVGYSNNTVITTMSKMRAVLNSIELKGPNPFSRVTVGSPTAAKADALSMAEVQKIRHYIPTSDRERIAKDTFLFSFYAAGMRSADVLQLPWSAVKGDRIVYSQSKKLHTGKSDLSIPINPVLAEILGRYDRSTPTIFNLVKLTGGSRDAIEERKSVQAIIVRTLRAIAERCEISTPISFKLARTSFARIANEASGRNVYGIQQAMGHTGVKTTEIYLGSDTRAVDELLKVVYG